MRIISSFIGFLLAITLSIFIFAPDRLPAGYGFEPVPIELSVENSLAGELVQSITGKSGKNLVLKNTAKKPIYNLTVTLRDDQRQIKHQYIQSRFPAAEQVTLGWAKKWSINTGDELEVMASTFYKIEWAL